MGVKVAQFDRVFEFCNRRQIEVIPPVLFQKMTDEIINMQNVSHLFTCTAIANIFQRLFPKMFCHP